MTEPVTNPQSWDKAVSAAYLRSLGASQETAAKSAGIGKRTLQRYETSPWWPDAVAEAEDRWLNDVKGAAKRRLLAAIETSDSVDSLLRVVERLVPDLAPSPTKHDVTLTVQQRIQQLPPQEIQRLERLPDDELRNELKRLESGDAD